MKLAIGFSPKTSVTLPRHREGGTAGGRDRGSGHRGGGHRHSGGRQGQGGHRGGGLGASHVDGFTKNGLQPQQFAVCKKKKKRQPQNTRACRQMMA